MTLTESKKEAIQQGARAPEFSLKGTDGELYSFPKDKKLVLIVFMCNHCPYVLAKLDELNRIATTLKDYVTVIGINSNNNPDYPEDSYENMQAMVTEGKIKFLYLFDEDQSVAKKYGAVCTPDPFLFQNGRFVFHTRIGEPTGPQPIENPELYDIIVEYIQTGYTLKNEKPSMGCNIKWVQSETKDE